ncbi:hypothetical protein [Vibrio splendidus]|uniref:hypothetical protein n=1 Tax=Vibrio splendidus TaxID=29497 RepID=UPI000D3C32B1|nr:hypothetical protein [Vibrio splendidus]PTO78347.1 hypothetical protein CWN84_07780 [Vibrio splendidus]
MSTLQGIPTQHGISILKSNLKQTAKKFQLIGALTHNAPTASLSVFHTDTIEASYYDDNGVLTFVFNLPIETHFNEYLYQIKIVDTAGQSIVDCQTPVIALAKGIGGMVTLKAAVSGQAGQVIFKHNQYVTETELLGLHFSKLKKELLELRCGEIELFDDPNPRAGWVDLDGAPLSRTTDALLWAHAQRTGLLITQALKETNHKKWAAYWGTGDGSTTFTRPNAHLVGAYIRATPAGVAHGEYQGDAIRNFTGKIDSNWNVFNEMPSGTSGVFKHGNADYEYEIQRTANTHSTITGSVLIDASLQVPTAAENRPHSINYAAKIHRGWM